MSTNRKRNSILDIFRSNPHDPYAQETALNLAAAYQAIERYLKSKAKPSEKEFLIQLLNRIRAIETAQRGWLKAERELLDSEKNKTQEELLEQVAQAHKKSIGFTHITVQKLIQDILKELGNPGLSESCFQLLAFVNRCAESVLSTFKKDITVPDESKPYQLRVNNSNDDTYLGSNVPFSFITSLGGRAIPASQILDPLRGKEKRGDREMDFAGACYGHVMSWVKAIQKYGKDLFLIGLDTNTFHYQSNQNLGNPKTFARYQSSTEIAGVVEKVVSNITDENRIYGLSAVRKTNYNHFMGVRKIPGSSMIEMVDSENGLVVFPDLEHFKIWLKTFYSIFYSDRAGGALLLYDIGKQPANATASIPLDIAPKPFSFGVEEVKQFVQETKKTFEDVCKNHDQATNYFSFLQKRYELRSHFFSNVGPDLSVVIDSEFREFQKYRYRLSRGISADNNKSNESEESINNYHKNLKLKAINKIDEQLKKLGKQNGEVRSALIDLRSEILDAPQSLTLSAIVGQWSLMPSEYGMFTHGEVIRKNQKISEFISHLVKTHEVSPINLSLMQEMLLQKIMAMVRSRNWGSQMSFLSDKTQLENGNRMPLGLLRMRTEFLRGEGNLKDLLSRICQIGGANYGNWFWCQLHGQNDSVNTLYSTLKGIDVDNPYDLLKAFSNLEQLDRSVFRGIAVDYDAAPVVSSNPAPKA